MSGQPELVDNKDRYGHAEALRWLAEHRVGPLAVATGYVRLGGLVVLATLPKPDDRRVRLLLGAVPEPGLGASPVGAGEARLVDESFAEVLKRLREERDFDAFPASRRTESLDLVEGFVTSDRVEVRRYTERFLHGKTYLFGELGADGALAGEGAALVTSANLTSGGLEHNLELGMVEYQPNMVGLTLEWFDKLWDEAVDYRDELLDLLYPPPEDYSPQEIFHRALLELYGEQIEREAEELGVGAVTLARFMEDGYRRARRIIEEHGGVIYADGVGTGKTTIGLRFISDYAKERGLYTLVIAPAQLRDSLWEDKLIEAGLPHEILSYQELAADRQLGGTQKRLHLNKDLYRLIVVDEAHAFRNADNSWYAALDRLLGGAHKDIVMLTATPVNNSLWDLHNLVLLFGRHDAAFRAAPLSIPSLRSLFVEAGAQDPEQIREEVLFPLVDSLAVRRDRRFIEEHYAGETFPDGTPVRFPEPRLEEVRYDLDRAFPGLFREVVETIGALTMARYVPARYALEGVDVERLGQVAREEALAGLMQSQLLKRFESSAAAAHRTLERMVRAHEVLIEAWEGQGKVPSIASLRDLVRDLQDDDPLPALVEAALEDDDDSVAVECFDPKFLEDTKADLERLQQIHTRLEELVVDPKLEVLAETLRRTNAAKVAVFSSYADTAEYLREQLELDPERFGGRSFTVVVGAKTDPEERIRQLERFAPATVTGDKDFVPAGGEVDLLVSTDVLSEGQNLQQAQAVISYDLPWNPQRVVQRNGRIIRLGSHHDQVFLYTILPKHGDLEEALRLEARVRGKIAAANATFGMESQVLVDVEAMERAYADALREGEQAARADLEEFFGKIEANNETLLDEGQGKGSGSFVGEVYRLQLSRLLQEGEFPRLRGLPWGVGSVFAKPGLPPERAGVFFACRSMAGERFWRYVTFQGVVVREDLAMLRLIDPEEQPRAAFPGVDEIESAWDAAAADICERFAKERLDPKQREAQLAASQRWALGILRSPDLSSEAAYDRADQCLGVGRNQLVRRSLSETRRRAADEAMSLKEAADEIVQVVDKFGLRPEPPTEGPIRPLTRDELGVVCYQVVLPG